MWDYRWSPTDYEHLFPAKHIDSLEDQYSTWDTLVELNRLLGRQVFWPYLIPVFTFWHPMTIITNESWPPQQPERQSFSNYPFLLLYKSLVIKYLVTLWVYERIDKCRIQFCININDLRSRHWALPVIQTVLLSSVITHPPFPKTTITAIYNSLFMS